MPSRTPTKGARRGKSDPRMALVKWARENGALHIKVDGIELMFPPNYGQEAQEGRLSPEDIVRCGSKEPGFNPNAPDVVVSQHPDEFAENSDRWGNFSPYAARG